MQNRNFTNDAQPMGRTTPEKSSERKRLFSTTIAGGVTRVTGDTQAVEIYCVVDCSSTPSESSDAQGSRPLISKLFHVGLGLYALSFFLPAVRGSWSLPGWYCGWISLWGWAVLPDPRMSPLLVAGRFQRAYQPCRDCLRGVARPGPGCEDTSGSFDHPSDLHCSHVVFSLYPLYRV